MLSVLGSGDSLLGVVSEEAASEVVVAVVVVAVVVAVVVVEVAVLSGKSCEYSLPPWFTGGGGEKERERERERGGMKGGREEGREIIKDMAL